jgi:asparagine synthase (glutamine-hydrolysing)
MSATLTHRGPDDAGSWVDAGAGVALGHRRLSILDLSAAGHQPMISADGRHVLAFNGEIYNFRVLRDRLRASGSRFRGDSDTEVLLEAIAAWGVRRAIDAAVGMFAFAVWDRERRELTLARDRMGEKPLYYGLVSGTFLFASELKALRKHPRWGGEIDRAALTLFMRHNYVPSPYTIHRGIQKLPAACTLRVEWGTRPTVRHPEPYWSIPVGSREATLPRADGEVVDRLEVLLRQAIRDQIVADVPVGAFLSGGIDSSTVVALMQQESSRPVRTFTIGVHDSATDEAPDARTIAAHLGTDHTEVYVTSDDALQTIPRLSEIYDEPFADSSQIPTLLVASTARRSVTVALSGDGGDELFGGYPRYIRGPFLASRVSRVPRAFRRSLASLLASGPVTSGVKSLFHGTGTTRAERLIRLAEVLEADSPLGAHRALLSNWIQPADLVLGGSEPPTALTSPAASPPHRSFAERMLLADSVSYLPDDLLVKVDRAAMAVSLETRLPMLDHRLVEFAWGLPWHMKVRDGQLKWVLRQVLHRYVPKALVDRPKRGFGVPVDRWLRGPLRAWASDLLQPERIRAEGYFRPDIVTRRWQEHLAGASDWSYPLWTLLMFQDWHEKHEPGVSHG